MDSIVQFVDDSFVKPLADGHLQPRLAESLLLRQFVSLELIVLSGSFLLYFGAASFTYWLFYRRLKHVYHPDSGPQPYAGQVADEIAVSARALPVMAQMFVPFLLLQIRGHSRLYSSLDDYGWPYFVLSALMLLLWSDTLIYWIHRTEHHPRYYKHVHKLHHSFKVVTPYACFAFHPIDGFLQASPYIIFPFFFPIHKLFYVCAFVAVQLWTVLIHDGVQLASFYWLNGAGHHWLHHIKFNYNYGQYLTFWDRFCGTHMDPKHSD